MKKTLVLVALCYGCLVASFGQQKLQYEKAKVIGWSSEESSFLYSTSEINYGSGVKTPARTTQMPIRYLKVELEASDAVYMIHARKWDVEIGKEIEFRRLQGVKDKKPVVQALIVRHADGKEKKYALVGMRALPKKPE